MRVTDVETFVVDEYDSDAILVTLGGDGTILHAARTFSDPTILPVRTGNSKGYKTTLEAEQLVATLDELDSGQQGEAVPATTYQKIAAYRDESQLRGVFDAVNEISVHHSSPTKAAVLSIRIQDSDEYHEFDRVIGDGVLVATPFGPTAYYRSITEGTISQGLGVAVNNVHTPVDTPQYLQLSSDGFVEVEMLESEHASNAILTRDNADEMYELPIREPVTIRHSPETVEILTLDDLAS